MTLPNGENILFETANRNKKSLTLDLKKEKGRQLLYELISKADIFCTNFTQSAIAKLKIDFETLRKYNPKLIYGLATGYGLVGPESSRRAFDSVAQARSGIMYALGGEPDTPPAQIGGPVFDQMTGTLLVYGILAALVARDRQGAGQQVEVSLLGSGIHLQAYNLNTALLRGARSRRPSRRSLKNPMANHFECADGEWLLLSDLRPTGSGLSSAMPGHPAPRKG
jgi:crotonobetainyl-CoA:carnitine CoA-transferase CaiB-like acyl-CoA transferase